MALFYLIRKGVKNSLLELKRKPGKLVLYLLVIALLVFAVILSSLSEQGGGGGLPLFWLEGVFFAFLTIFTVLTLRSALSSGSSFFEMSDVNLLFVSPVDSRATLLYGIVRLTKTAFLAGLFLPFQAANLRLHFGVGSGGVWLLLLAFMLCMICLTVLSVLIYNATNGRPGRKRAVCVCAVLLHLPVTALLLSRLPALGAAGAVGSALASPVFGWLPVTGWAARGVSLLFAGETARGVLSLSLIAALTALLVVYLLVSRTDYYEDVLCATETAFEKKRAALDGNINASASARRIRVSATGVGGRGASALFHKHLRESFRENRFGIVGLSTVFFTLGAAALSFLLRGAFVSLLVTMMWIQIFFIGSGRGLRELYSHHIYLLPASPFSKIVWNCAEVMLRALTDGVLIFGISGFLQKVSPLVVLAVIAAYALFSLFLLGINHLALRWAGADISTGLLLLLYVLAAAAALLPGAVPALIVSAAVGGEAGALLGLLILSAWEALAAVLFFALSRGILHNCDMPVMKWGKS